MNQAREITALALMAGFCATRALAQPDPSGIEFVTVGAPGNAPYQTTNPNDRVNGRGDVNYVYRIGKHEVTTAEWAAFFNAAYDRSDAPIPHLAPPQNWGAVPTTPINPGRQRWTVPVGNEMRPVGGISWRMAAIFCNWLHNNRSSDRAAFLNGVFDVSTFGWFGNIYTDQAEHHPDAKYWIPTWDEWLKAAHYDPNRYGQGVGGWWQYSNGTDTPYVYGLPGFGQANAGFWGGFEVPLGSYTTTSPWGVLDMAGATAEWTGSEVVFGGGTRHRYYEGSYRGSDLFTADYYDRIRLYGLEDPNLNSDWYGLRIATTALTCNACDCDGDVNCDGILDGFDVQVMERATGGDTVDFCQLDPDFNRDGNLDGFDVEAVERVTAGAPCP